MILGDFNNSSSFRAGCCTRPRQAPYIYIYIYIYIYTHIHIYIYIERERDIDT